MKNTLVIDLDRCSGCDSCVSACKHENQMGLGVVRNHVSAVGPVGTFPDIEMYWLPMQCQQCENPGCIEVCPTGASYRDEETGVVLVNAEDCIGCESSKAVAAAGENAHYLWDPASLSPTTVYILSEKTAKWQDEPVEVTRYEKQ